MISYCYRLSLLIICQSLQHVQSTVKLVATSMIAAGKVAEGCQLLCLINKALDACRYLQTYGQWHQVELVS